jgi:hypothetical protein
MRGPICRCIAAYLYSAAGPGESTTDLSWDGHALIYENGDCLTESQRFAADEHVIAADVDLERLQQDRMRLSSFSDSAAIIVPRPNACAGSPSRLNRRPARFHYNARLPVFRLCRMIRPRVMRVVTKPTTFRSMA